MRFRKSAPIAIILLGAGLYILLPTLDEILIHPVFGLFLSEILGMPFTHGIGISIIIYRAIGIICLISALLIGGKPIFQKLKTKFQKRNNRHQD